MGKKVTIDLRKSPATTIISMAGCDGLGFNYEAMARDSALQAALPKKPASLSVRALHEIPPDLPHVDVVLTRNPHQRDE